MASTNHTTNFTLNQWIPSDPVLREDFNADNSKIDAALGSTALRKLKHGVLTQSAQEINIDLSDLDLSLYAELQILFSFSAPAPLDYELQMRLNHLSSIYDLAEAPGSHPICFQFHYIPRNERGLCNIHLQLGGVTLGGFCQRSCRSYNNSRTAAPEPFYLCIPTSCPPSP